VTDCEVDGDTSPAVLKLAAAAAVRRLGKVATDSLTLLHPVRERAMNDDGGGLQTLRPGLAAFTLSGQ
jgi:hypothetical protein